MNKYIVAVAVAVLASMLMITYTVGRANGVNATTALWHSERAATQQRYLEREAEYRKKEAQWAIDVDNIRNEYDERIKSIQDAADSVLADRESGELRLRERFQSCERKLAGMSSASGGAASHDGASESGLSRADEAFLIRIATQADEIAAKLRYWQERESVLQSP